MKIDLREKAIESSQLARDTNLKTDHRAAWKACLIYVDSIKNNVDQWSVFISAAKYHADRECGLT